MGFWKAKELSSPSLHHTLWCEISSHSFRTEHSSWCSTELLQKGQGKRHEIHFVKKTTEFSHLAFLPLVELETI